MKLNIEYFDSTEELLNVNGNSPNVRDLNNLNLLVRADTSDIAADSGGADNDELLIYQFQRDFFGVYATARLLSEKRILVLAGSRISKEDSLLHQKGQEASERLRQELIETGVVDEQERTFNADYEFHSTSSAASVIMGQSANGLTTWKDGAGHKLNELLGRIDKGYKGRRDW